MSKTNNINKIRPALIVAFLAFLASHQVRGRTPLSAKVTTPAILTQMTLAATNKNAPKDNSHFPSPKSIPHVTSGGMSATATITPMRAAGAPVEKASVPAEPAARARIRSLEPIDVLAAIAGVSGATSNTKPTHTAKKKEIESPAVVVNVLRSVSSGGRLL